jgi:hypothetical protein
MMSLPSDQSDSEAEPPEDLKTWDVYADKNFLHFLQHGSFSVELDDTEKRRIRARAKNYTYDPVDQLVLYKGKRLFAPTPFPV